MELESTRIIGYRVAIWNVLLFICWGCEDQGATFDFLNMEKLMLRTALLLRGIQHELYDGFIFYT